jgi:hypothetical protein
VGCYLNRRASRRIDAVRGETDANLYRSRCTRRRPGVSARGHARAGERHHGAGCGPPSPLSLQAAVCHESAPGKTGPKAARVLRRGASPPGSLGWDRHRIWPEAGMRKSCLRSVAAVSI